MRRGRRLAIDVGDARIGVASCDPDGIIATPVETVPGRDVPAAHRRLGQLVAEYEPIEVIIGLPRSLGGGEGPAAAKVRAFAGSLFLPNAFFEMMLRFHIASTMNVIFT